MIDTSAEKQDTLRQTRAVWEALEGERRTARRECLAGEG